MKQSSSIIQTCQESVTAENYYHRNRGFSCVGLVSPRDKKNIGSVIRAAGCFKAAFVAVSGSSVQEKYLRADPMKMNRHLPVLQVSEIHKVLPFQCVPVAVELADQAMSLVDYLHPGRAFYIFGPENGSLGSKILNWCQDVVYIPVSNCLNLAAAVNVVLYDRLIKMETNQGKIINYSDKII